MKIEAGKGCAEILTLSEDRQPGEAGLKAFEADLLKEPDVIRDGAAPFLVVIAAIVFETAMPKAAVETVISPDQAFRDHVHMILP
jgi:hypothetical protein